LAETAKRGSGFFSTRRSRKFRCEGFKNGRMRADYFRRPNIGRARRNRRAYSSAFNESDLELCALLCSLSSSGFCD
jgi:hypothetical protein